MAKLAPLHPGEVLREEFMVPMGLTAYALAERCHIPRTRIERIASEQTSISADTALRLAKALGTTPEFWLNLQARYAVEVTKPKIKRDLETIEMASAAKAA
ncbi:HigA family addiction module antitoxin [Bradyrhizobium canariense]|uniref:Plasmid maintenance system antidote protein, XRE family n=1 Tax=Bradyrhizobium canariense TaxID=255045 RepID=A0A1H1Y8Y7_9BRAD|nr:HigA family addiction module antitoxin [Bradyrhizobium canariense]SDT17824.1 plasmid maintenance system antidote protein, XRE family [Bradyrhizobium canariense]